MSQEKIAQIVSIEKAAVKLYDDARQEAERLTEEAKGAAHLVREQTLTHARQQAAQIAAQSTQTAEIEHVRIMAQAEAEAQELERVAAENFDHATRFVLDQITGRD